MENEIWKDIEGFDRLYQVSNFGRIASMFVINKFGLWKKRKIPLIRKVSFNADGYLQLWLQVNGIGRTVSLHRIVGIHHVKNPLGLPEINHLDGDKSNCRADNLEWTTRSGNVQHAYDNGFKVAKRGETNGKAKITNQMAIEIANSNKDSRILAKKFGVSRNTIFNIKAGRVWSGVTGKIANQ